MLSCLQYCAMNNVTSPCSYIHHSGFGSECISPAPPDEGICHRYQTTTYMESCTVLPEWANSMDVNGLFDSQTGILKSCSDKVLSTYTSCWTYPADDPVPCACPV